jgi:hypothetical protein
MQSEITIRITYSVSSIWATGEAGNHAGLFGKQVNNFPLPFITPLGANDSN